MSSERANRPDELLDRVDEHDRVVGTVRKGDTERDPSLIHREVAILIHRDGGRELLWQLRSAEKSVLPLTWDFACAGHVEAGDEPLAAAHRELLEELGFETELELLERRLVRQPWESYFVSVFAGPLPPRTELRLDPDEVAAVEWCDAAGLRRWAAEGRRLSGVAREMAEAFWSGALR
ncbi:MAG TPA: NUDIX domain-containing protein [Solirubrobacteraceae bacterium]|nr:NUDIX domain-containing protein [Solirubrobacteraceae bacterium]